MLRLVTYIVALALACALAAYLAVHPGQVSLRWEEWRVETSFAFLLFLALALSAALTACILFIRALWAGPARFRRRRREKHYALGLSALTQTMVALMNNDANLARKQLNQAKKYLNHAPATLMLDAQLAKLQGNDAGIQTALEAMLAHRETKRIAAKGLSDYYGRHEDAASALPHAALAFSMNRRDVEALKSLVSAHLRLGEWQQAQLAVKRSGFGIPRAERAHLLTVIYHSQAVALEAAGEFSTALAFARLAAKKEASFAPAVALLARLAEQNHASKEAGVVLARAWKAVPHPLLALAMEKRLAGLAPADALKALKKLTHGASDDEETHLLLAKWAMAAKAWDEARVRLKAALAQRESALACELMAALETAQYRDSEAAARWRARTATAEPEAGWHCALCAAEAAMWQAYCPRCHGFDQLEWKRRILR